MKERNRKGRRPTPRLIERWLPIAALGEESVRERRSMTALPPTYYLHVWWARRPLVASRAAVLASLLPSDTDEKKFMHILGIHGDPVSARRRIDAAKSSGEDLGADVYGYKRAFSYSPTVTERAWTAAELQRIGLESPVVLDPTAGGGSIPFESLRLGLPVVANDINPVAALILKHTVEFPRLGTSVLSRFRQLSEEFVKRCTSRLTGVFPLEPDGGRVDGYLWARTITCPSCNGVIPLSPNWRLAPGGVGIRLKPNAKKGLCDFDIVKTEREQSEGTVADGHARCPYAGCERVVHGDEVKRQAQTGQMGEQLYAVAYKRRVAKRNRNGSTRESWERGYRAARPSDDISQSVTNRLEERMPEWEALDIVPTEPILDGLKTAEPIRYGMRTWRELFSKRQLLGHGTAVEVYRELLEEARAKNSLDETGRAAFGYLALSLDKLRDYNSRMTRWHSKRQVVVNTFDRHDFAMKWSYAEIAPAIVGSGYTWVINQTAKCIGELLELAGPQRPNAPLRNGSAGLPKPKQPELSHLRISSQSADGLPFLEAESVDAIVMDPPYGGNLMYAELSDFFYVWLKRTAGHVYPELFRRKLTDKDREAVANPARFKGEKGAARLADRDYREKMAAIFSECRRVLKPDGVLTVMFTHRANGAWNALARGIIEAGFSITASWPVNTEAEGSLHIKDKAAAKSTIFLVCRPRPPKAIGSTSTSYWEEVEPSVAAAVRARIEEFAEAGIKGVDLYLACFGPALNELAKHWPLVRGKPRALLDSGKPARGRGKNKEGDPIEDPYAVTPDDALDAARREVKRWRLEHLERTKRRVELDPLTEFYILAWDAFGAAEFPYDEALRLARVVGLDLDADVIKRVAVKKGDSVLLWDSAARAAQGKLGPEDGSRSVLDALQHAANRARNANIGAARDLIAAHKADKAAAFLPALSALLEVLPMPPKGHKPNAKAKGSAELVEGAARDFEVLEQLRRLAYAGRIPPPERLGGDTSKQAA